MYVEAEPQDILERIEKLKNLNLIDSDGEPLESSWHRDCATLLIEQILYFFLGRTDFYVGGNMFIYYSLAQVMNRDYAKAGQLLENLEDYAKAAAMYERADDHYMAAEMYTRANDLGRAAEQFEKHGNYQQAAEFFLKVNLFDKAAVNFEKSVNKDGCRVENQRARRGSPDPAARPTEGLQECPGT